MNKLKQMIVTRKQHHVFGRGTCEFLETENDAVLAYMRQWNGAMILVAHNLCTLPQRVGLPLANWNGAHVTDLLTQKQFAPIKRESYELTLESLEFVWLELKR